MASWDTCARVYFHARLLCLFVFVCIWKWYSPLRSGLSTSFSSVLLTFLTPPDALPAPRLSWVHLSDVFHQTWLTWFSSIREISPSPFFLRLIFHVMLTLWKHGKWSIREYIFELYRLLIYLLSLSLLLLLFIQVDLYQWLFSKLWI